MGQAAIVALLKAAAPGVSRAVVGLGLGATEAELAAVEVAHAPAQLLVYQF
jgi:hypothetical protein